ncbi:FAD-dependent monooxygenase [Streptomyces sp. NPDC048659]|uniref:FAD-dependent monooxygenase n=1 Tax=Streptomyces sp. NPDC048659 TaxID=3155489 RepID=UPI003448D7E4
MAGVDVCVVGAGPVGLTLAIALRRLGLGVRVVDRAPGAGRGARALVVWPRAAEALESLGVLGALRDRAVELGGVTVHGLGRRLGELVTGWHRSAHRRPLTIERHDLVRLLCGELARLGTKVEWDTEVTDVAVCDDRAEFTLRLPDATAESGTAGWIVGCEGTDGVVRDRLGIPLEGRRGAGTQLVQGNAEADWPHGRRPGHGHVFLAPRRSVLALPLPGGGYRFLCLRDDPDPARTGPPTLDELRDLVADTARVPGLRLFPTEPLWLDRARFGRRFAARLRHGRGLLAGDAAHAWAPAGGHGMSVGILGAHNLAWKLASVHRGQADEALLDTYCTEQRALALKYVRDARRTFLELPLPPIGYRALAAVLPLALAVSRVQQRVDLRSSGLGRGHRGSALSWQQAPRSRRGRGARAGDRMPDARVTTGIPGSPRAAGAEPVRLHSLLSYERWTLLLDAARAADPGVRTALEEACTRASVPLLVLPVSPAEPAEARLLGPPDELRLVRPDGYVGLVAPVARPGLLASYLSALAPGAASATVTATGRGRGACPGLVP